MAKRRQNASRGGQRNGTGSRSRRGGNPRIQAPLRLQQSGTSQVQEWFCVSGVIPKVAHGQTVYSLNVDLTPKNVPGLQDFMSRHQMVVVHSLSARFKSGMTFMDGQSAISVITHDRDAQMTYPATFRLSWHRANGAVVYPMVRQANSSPCAPLVKIPIAAVSSAGQEAGTSLGRIIWTFEGPSSTDDRTHLGEFEVYVNATFSGL